MAPNTPSGWALQLINAFYRVGAWVWRAGARLVHPIEYSDQLRGAWGFKTVSAAVPQLTLIAASGGINTIVAQFLQLVGAGFAAIPYNNVAAQMANANDSWRSWSAAITSDTILYACRRRTDNLGRLYHVTADQVTAAGVDPPPTPTVVSSGTPGALTAGVYPVGCRYVTADGMYSPMSPVPPTVGGGLVTVAANEKRRWTLTASTHPRVTGIELMAGFDGGAADNVYFAFLAPNISAVVDEDVIDLAYDKIRAGHPGLVVPPPNPECTGKWDARQWVLTNDPDPLLYPSFIDESGSLWELFDPQEALAPPTSGTSRWMSFRAWDRSRAACLTDTSVHIIQPGSGSSYTFSDVSTQHGCVAEAACDVGAGMLVWFDGRNVLSSDGGPAQIISKGWIDHALAQVPPAYADRTIVKYSPNDGGAFWVSFPSTPTSTSNDLVVCWDGTQWHERKYFGEVGLAPVYMNRIPAADSGGEWTVGIFTNSNRVIRLDAPVRRDEGPYNILTTIETGQVPIPAGYATVAVARVHIGVRRRADTTTTDPGSPITASVSLRLNDAATTTTPVTATVPTGQQYMHARAQNLGAPKSGVSVVMTFNCPDILEVFDVSVECVLYKREEKTT